MQLDALRARTRGLVLAAIAAGALLGLALIGLRAWRRQPRAAPAIVEGSPVAARRKLPPGLAVINAHEHALGRRAIPRLLQAMDELGLAKTVVCAGSTMTTLGRKDVGFVGYDQNNEEMLAIARRWPERFVPFVTLDPTDSDNIERLERWIKRGAKGVKLYSGHGNFHHLSLGGGAYLDRPLDHPSLMPVYRWLAHHRVPVLWHVNTGLYLDELRRVLDQVPGLRLDCPHHCMSTEHPETVRQLLLDFPNLSVDLSHGFHTFMADALRRISENRPAFRALYDEFPDRFFWGSDTVVTLHRRKDAAWIEDMMGAYFGLYAERQFRLPVFDEAYAKVRDEWLPGLALPESLLRRFFQGNAERWLAVRALDAPVPGAGWPAWANDPDRLGMREALAHSDWEALAAAANRLACSTDLPSSVRRSSADALRRVVYDPRVPAAVAIGLAHGLPGLACLEPEDWQRVRAERGPELVRATRRMLDEQLARRAFPAMQATLADLTGAELGLDESDVQILLPRLLATVSGLLEEQDLSKAYRGLLVARMLRPDAREVADRLAALQPRIERPLIAAQQLVYSDLSDGIAVAITSASADADGLLLRLGLRNRLDAGTRIEAADFAVAGSAGRAAPGQPAAGEAPSWALEAGAKAFVQLHFRLPGGKEPLFLTYRGGGGKKFVLKP